MGFLGSLFNNDNDRPQDEGNSNSWETEEPQTTIAPLEKPLPPAPASLLEAVQFSKEQLESSFQESCSAIETSLKDSALLENTKRRTASLTSIKDAYKASDFVEDNKWVLASANDDSLAAIKDSFVSRFQQLLSKSTFVGASDLRENYPTEYRSYLEEYRLGNLSHCGLEERVSDMEALSSQAVRIESLADNVPWYPQGFNVYKSGDVAWKWADRSCSYYSGVCWHMDVVSQVGCSSLYVEINVEDRSGSLVDWTNDTARGMSAGQVAELEFVSFTDGARTASVGEISCY